MSINFGIDDFGTQMAKTDRGAGKEKLKEVFVGKRVYNRFYGNGAIKEIKNGKLYIHFDSGEDRIFTDAKYLWEEM